MVIVNDGNTVLLLNFDDASFVLDDAAGGSAKAIALILSEPSETPPPAQTVLYISDVKTIDIQAPTASENMRVLPVRALFQLYEVRASVEGSGATITIDIGWRDWDDPYTGTFTSVLAAPLVVTEAGVVLVDTSGVASKFAGETPGQIDGTVDQKKIVLITTAKTGTPTFLAVDLTYRMERL